MSSFSMPMMYALRIGIEAACTRLGEGDARRAFSMALNKEGHKSFTTMRRALSLQSSPPPPRGGERNDAFEGIDAVHALDHV